MSSSGHQIHRSVAVSRSFTRHWMRVALLDLLRLVNILLLALMVAVPAGLAGAFFRQSVLWANQIREAFPVLIYFLPVGGLLIALLYRLAHISHRGENAMFTEILCSPEKSERKDISPWFVPLIYAASVLSHLFGASVGCEGVSVQIGGGIGARLARFYHLSERDFALLVFCAMASAFAPLLGTPIAAAIFVIERMNWQRFLLIFPCLAASFFSFTLSQWLGLAPFRFELEYIPVFSIETAGKILILAGICLAVGCVFRQLLQNITYLCDRFLPNRFCAMGAGGALLLLLMLSLGTTEFCGAGLPGIFSALNGSAKTWAFFGKILFTSLALGIGFKGGQIVPAFFVGATLGCVLAPLLGLEASFAAALGLITLFAAVVQCPITAAILALEMFPGIGWGWFTLAVLATVVPLKIFRPAKTR